MKLHIITIGAPKLHYAKQGWEEYFQRLKHYHQLTVTQLADTYADDSHAILAASADSYRVALVIDGQQWNSHQLAAFLEDRSQEGRPISFIIGGPNGLPLEVIKQSNQQWSFSKLTFPHDLAMVILLESLYRASTLNSCHPYHR